jgi:hypothetical protein
MSGSGEKQFRIGDLIQRGENYGQITGGAKGAWTIKIYNDKGVLGSASTGVADSELKRGGYKKFMSKNGITSVMEVAWNAIIYAIIQKVRKSNPTFGPRFYSFVMSDAAYELFLKYFIENMVPFFRPEAVAAEETGWFPAQGDLQDAVKSIPIALLQELALKMIYRRKLFSHFLKNLIDAFIAITGGNYSGRLFTTSFASITGADVYRW